MNRVLLSLLVLLSVPATAAAQDPCAHDAFGLTTGPTRAGLLGGDLGAGWRACGRNEIGVSFGGGLTVDLPNFYGALAAPLALDGSVAVTDRFEVFGQIELLRVDYLITPLSSSSIGLGHTSIGVSYGFLRSTKLALAAHSRVVLPTARPLYRNAYPLTLDAGFAGQLEINRHVQLHGDATVLMGVMGGKGPAAPRGGGTVLLGAQFVPIPEVSLVLDMKSRFGWGGEPLDMLAGAIGVRLSDCKRFGFEIDATIPITGRERAAVAVELRASVRLGKIERPLWPDSEMKKRKKKKDA